MNTNLRTPSLPLSRRDVFGRNPFRALFDEFFTEPWLPTGVLPSVAELPNMPNVTRARMDVVDKGPSYLVTVDLPGVKKEDINVSIDGTRVMIDAAVSTETPIKEGEKLLYTERYTANFARAFELPIEVTETGAEAVFENGVLTLTLPKREPTAGRKLAIH